MNIKKLFHSYKYTESTEYLSYEKRLRLGLLVPAESLRDNLRAVYSYARSLYKDGKAQLSSTAADKGEQPQTVACVQIRYYKKLFSSEGSTTLEQMT